MDNLLEKRVRQFQSLQLPGQHLVTDLCAEIERLQHLMARCRCVLNNMAWEREGAWFNRWPINHEPLRADAKNLLPEIDKVLGCTHGQSAT